VIKFYKYQGTGNDFVMIDNRSSFFPSEDLALVQQLCSRRFGIGADGLILIQTHDEADFEMVYFNADGSRSFCGNGSRCAVAFSKFLGIIENTCRFLAIDGFHEAKIDKQGQVHLKMNDVNGIETIEEDLFLNTGSPHYIHYVDDVHAEDVVAYGRSIRYGTRFKKQGTNVNLVHCSDGKLYVRTYERGVEDETFSCGTGVTAVALSAYFKGLGSSPFPIITKGGNLEVSFESSGKDSFHSIWLIGPAEYVFQGEIDV
jgi:diaminopimelate epimerase